MLAIGSTLVSLDLFDEYFACELAACKGACCVAGDYGAPLEEEECKALENIYPHIADMLTPEGRSTIEEYGKYVFVPEAGHHATPVCSSGACAYAVFQNGMARCGIELAWRAGKSDLRKPISCHLYPIRIQKHKHYEAVNYDRWHICKPACKNGKANAIPLFRFVKEAIIRKYGEDYYQALEEFYQQKTASLP
ncbi:MAG: DUF3109 family protein [Chitinophagales bacterium]|nr:DUF3109 family protein [Chitinophagales bacterium]